MDFYQSTPDAELIYTGDDYIVWDRVNAERLRRGLPSLTAIGYPRPEDAPGAVPNSAGAGGGQGYTFTAPSGETYTVSAPNGVSREQAQAIFNQQFSTGGLKTLGIGQTLEGLPKAASDALGSIKKLTNVPVSLPIDPADILKQTPALKGIGTMSAQQVTGLVGAAAAAAGQPMDAVSVNKGIGKFGLTPQQLEQQGFVKPGMLSSFNSAPIIPTAADIAEAQKINSNGTESITPDQVAQNRKLNQLLSSPMAWTGKSSVNNLDGFLNNASVQNLTQQNLMTEGFAKMKSMSLVTGTESPEKLSAMVQGAAKFGTDTMSQWAKGSAPPDVASLINNVAKDAQFSVNVADQIPSVSKIMPEGVVDTVKRVSLDRAIKDAVADPKVPPIEYGPVERPPVPPDPNQPALEKYKTAYEAYFAKIQYFQERATAISQELIKMEEGTITQAGWDSINATMQSVREEYNNTMKALRAALLDAYAALTTDLSLTLSAQTNSVQRLHSIVFQFLQYLRDRIRDDELLIGT